MQDESAEYLDNQDLYEHFRFETDPGQRALRIDKYIQSRLVNTSRTRVQIAAHAGNILVDGKAVKPNYKVRPGSIIQIVLPQPPREIRLTPEDIPIDIVYEDDDVVIVNKMPGMVVHPGHGNHSGTLINALMWHFRNLPLFSSGDSRPGLVHRIDKNTSGLLVIAKNDFALTHLAKQFFDHTTGRKYTAIVWGEPKENEGTITGNIGRSPKDRKVMYVFKDGSDGKSAVTHYKVLEQLGYISVLECQLETGRTHQIRVHLCSENHPIFNDHDYGGNKILKGTSFTKYQQFVRNCFAILPRQALHARYLSFNHPVSGKRLEFEIDLPLDMTTVIEKWRTYIAGRRE